MKHVGRYSKKLSQDTINDHLDARSREMNESTSSFRNEFVFMLIVSNINICCQKKHEKIHVFKNKLKRNKQKRLFAT